MTWLKQVQQWNRLGHLCLISSQDGVTWIFLSIYPRVDIFHMLKMTTNKAYEKKKKKEEKDCKIFLLEDLQKAMLGGNLLLSSSIFHFAPLSLSLECLYSCLITLA